MLYTIPAHFIENNESGITSSTRSYLRVFLFLAFGTTTFFVVFCTPTMSCSSTFLSSALSSEFRPLRTFSSTHSSLFIFNGARAIASGRHDTTRNARDVCDARYADNSTDITFDEELRKSLDETVRLNKPLMKLELMKVMRAKRIPLPQDAKLEFLRNKLSEVDKQLNDANMTAITQSNVQRCKRTQTAHSAPDETISRVQTYLHNRARLRFSNAHDGAQTESDPSERRQNEE